MTRWSALPGRACSGRWFRAAMSSGSRRASGASSNAPISSGLSHLDVARDTSLGDLSRFLHPGARLLVTQGGHGGLLVTTGEDGPVEVLRYLPTPTEHEVDPTGAGDTFLAALLAVLVRPSVAASPGRSLARALRFAAAAGSLAVEDLGLAGVPDRAGGAPASGTRAGPARGPPQFDRAGRRRGPAPVVRNGRRRPPISAAPAPSSRGSGGRPAASRSWLPPRHRRAAARPPSDPSPRSVARSS